MMVRTASRTIWLCILFAVAVLFALLLGTGALAANPTADILSRSTQDTNRVGVSSSSAHVSGVAFGPSTLDATVPDSPATCTPNYTITQTENVTPVVGTDLVTGSQCDDCAFNIALPFSYSLYGQSFNS